MRRVLVIATLLLGLAACGDDGVDGGVATAGGSKDSGSAGSGKVDDEEAMLKFTQCLRENGIDVPDPEPGKAPTIDIRGDRAKMQKAMEACRELRPNGGAFEPDAEFMDQMREMAKCMRANGVPDFPDPDPNGGGIRIGKDTGIDPRDPDFQAAQEKCRDHLPEMPARPAGPQ